MTIELYNKVWGIIESGRIEDALKIVEKFNKDYDDTLEKYILVGGLYIDIGTISNNICTIQKGIELLSREIDNLKTQDIVAQSCYYNIANGYSSIFDLKKREDHLYGVMDKSTESRKARDFYYEALKCNSVNDNLKVQIYTNLANSLDMIGRGVEAITYYDKALQIDPNYGMALSNKGVALKHYARLTGEKWCIYYKLGYNLIKKGIDCGVTKESMIILRKEMDDINKYIDSSSQDFCRNDEMLSTNSDLESFLNGFCKEYKLFLTLCNECQQCNNALCDDLIINRMLVNSGEMQDDSIYMKLSAFINEIKQNYVAARFLFAQSRYKEIDLSFVDKNVSIVNTLNYVNNNINIQMLKFSFKNMFDVLDKIAIFINKYLNLGGNDRYVDFKSIWYKNNDKRKAIINETIRSTNNQNLYALFDINLDITVGKYKILNDIRNALTHRFLDVYEFGDRNLEYMNEDFLFEQTLNITRIVKSSIIYLLMFVNEEENKKIDTCKGTILEIPIKVISNE